ncbi:MAG TPA: HGGxSTG domain-containing protein, partial [Candidatus Hydrogenedentes bacterium]|nr:HGGxSTG domain-containing protein [Candidatus Hydrogenedentota bacterium]
MNSPTSPNPIPPVSSTSLGSTCSPAWDDAWVQTVNQAESKLGRRICGARTPSGTPCELAPEHKNGRCRFHGGFDLSGAQPGNRNAV